MIRNGGRTESGGAGKGTERFRSGGRMLFRKSFMRSTKLWQWSLNDLLGRQHEAYIFGFRGRSCAQNGTQDTKLEGGPRRPRAPGRLDRPVGGCPEPTVGGTDRTVTGGLKRRRPVRPRPQRGAALRSAEQHLPGWRRSAPFPVPISFAAGGPGAAGRPGAGGGTRRWGGSWR